MADKCQVETVSKISDNTVAVAGVFFDEAGTFKSRFNLRIRANTLEDIRRELAANLAAAKTATNIEKLIQPGEFDLTEPTPPEPEKPTEQDLWIAKSGKVAELRQRLSADHPELVTLQSEVDSEFKIEFLD